MRWRTAVIRSTARSTSSGVEAAPKLNRTAPRTICGDGDIAAIAGAGSAEPLEQAVPVEQAIPSRSAAITIA